METLSISPVSLFLQAGPVGKAVMALLGLASIYGWAVILEGVFASLRMRSAISDARQSGRAGKLAPVAAAGRLSAEIHLPGETVSERRQRIAEAMGRAGRDALSRAEGGLPNLAVIASVAPFVGLLGTVWGIMTSFVGIAAAKDTSLAVVAPGIAEALFATAIGLVAAIPAVLAYNKISTDLARMAGRLETFGTEFGAILSRQSEERV